MSNKEICIEHLQQYCSRHVMSLPIAKDHGWQLKRYAILADGRKFDNDIASSALIEAYARLPDAGNLVDEADNHGIGFQIVHFAELAVVSPVFYWQWGCVLANIGQMRANWITPTNFGNGVEEIVGCIWEMEVVSFEVNTWKNTLLNNVDTPTERLASYLQQHIV